MTSYKIGVEEFLKAHGDVWNICFCLADKYFEATESINVHLQYTHLFLKWRLVLYTVNSSLSIFLPSLGSPLDSLTFYTCCIHLAYSPQTKTAYLAIFLTLSLFPYTCHSHWILLIFVSLKFFFLLTPSFPLSLIYISASHIRWSYRNWVGVHSELTLQWTFNCRSFLEFEL